MKKLRQTSPNKWVGTIRTMLGIIFLMTGIMKLTLAEFGSAWSIQLIEAEIPFYAFNFWFVPIFEVIIGIILFIGYYSRIGAVMIIPIMSVAIYVHITVSNPAAFPAQPQEPIFPIAIIIMAVIVLINGGGNWSLDLKTTE
ncbi:MAG: DoxX family protein [Proteobacteria bacterium]|nr:DoxX family protein [Pseudomonadota bacterium]